MANFNGTFFSGPKGDSLFDANGDLFGTTASGGTDVLGTVFALLNNGGGTYALNSLASFTGAGAIGSFPLAGLLADANGDLFGTTDLGGGTNNAGTMRAGQG